MLQIGQINARTSLEDLRVLSSIFSRLASPFLTDKTHAETETVDPYALTQCTASYNVGLVTLVVVDGSSVSSPVFTSAVIRAVGGDLSGEGPVLPLIRLELSHVEVLSIANPGSAKVLPSVTTIRLNGSFTVAMSFFNPLLAKWEPILGSVFLFTNFYKIKAIFMSFFRAVCLEYQHGNQY